MPIHVFAQHSMNKVFFFSQNLTVSQLMSSCGYAYVGHVELPWKRGEENEEHGPTYLKWPETRYYQKIRTVHLFINCSTAEWEETIKPGTHRRQSWIQHGRLCWKSTVAETSNKVDCRRIRSTLLLIRSTLWPVLATNRQQRKIRQLVAVDFVADTVNFVADTFNCWFWQQISNNVNSTACRSWHCCWYSQLCCRYGRLCCQCVRGQNDTVDLQQVDRVEFNLVASLYRALRTASWRYVRYNAC